MLDRVKGKRIYAVNRGVDFDRFFQADKAHLNGGSCAARIPCMAKLVAGIRYGPAQFTKISTHFKIN